MKRRADQSPSKVVLWISVAALLVAACGGGGSDGDDIATETTSSAAPSSVAPTSTASESPPTTAGPTTVAPTTTSAPDAASLATVLAAVNNTAEVDSVRFEMWMSFRLADGEVDLDTASDTPIGRGSLIGGRVYTVVDMRALFEGIAGGLAGELTGDELAEFEQLMALGDRLIIEFVEDGDLMYMRAPVFGALAELDETLMDQPEIAMFAPIIDQWGVIDLSQAPLAADSLFGGAGGQQQDPTQFLRVLLDAEAATPAGTVMVRGEETTAFEIALPFGELLELQGLDEAAFVEEMARSGLSPTEAEMIAREMLAVETVSEVMIGADGFVRRSTVAIDFDQVIRSVAEQSGEDLSQLGPLGVSIDMRFEFFDYNSPDIELEVSGLEDAVDITDVFGVGSVGEGQFPAAVEECSDDLTADGYGDNAGCDQLQDACAGGNMTACDDLFWAVAVDSAYERYANGCGGRLDEDDPRWGQIDCVELG